MSARSRGGRQDDQLFDTGVGPARVSRWLVTPTTGGSRLPGRLLFVRICGPAAAASAVGSRPRSLHPGGRDLVVRVGLEGDADRDRREDRIAPHRGAIGEHDRCMCPVGPRSTQPSKLAAQNATDVLPGSSRAARAPHAGSSEGDAPLRHDLLISGTPSRGELGSAAVAMCWRICSISSRSGAMDCTSGSRLGGTCRPCSACSRVAGSCNGSSITPRSDEPHNANHSAPATMSLIPQTATIGAGPASNPWINASTSSR